MSKMASCLICRIRQMTHEILANKTSFFQRNKKLSTARRNILSINSVAAFEVNKKLSCVNEKNNNMEVEKHADDLFPGIKFVLVVGRFLGILPFSGVFKKSYSQLYFTFKSSAAITSSLILTVLTVNLSLGIIDTVQKPKRNAFEIANSVRATIQFLWAWLIYIAFLIRGKKFLALFHTWAKTSVHYGAPDCHLKRDVVLITLVVLLSAILENGVLHLEYIQSLDNISGNRFPVEKNGRNPLETYYNRSHDHWARMITFHEAIAVIVFIQQKCMLYGCNYIDILIAVFSRAISYKFETLYKVGKERLVKPIKLDHDEKVSRVNQDKNAWANIAHDHNKLCELLEEMEEFFSPLIFGSYAINIYYICVQLLEGLATDNTNSLVHSIYAPWSFIHIIMRLYLVSICAAEINFYAHRIRNVIQLCPVDLYNAEVARLDLKVTAGPNIGLSGFGCFVVTKPFILKIVGVVFTFEIVLLQGVSPPTC